MNDKLNMTILYDHLARSFNNNFQIKLKRPNLYQVYLPFYYPDGDMIEIFFSFIDGTNVLIQDKGLTLMRLSYDFALDSENKRKVFNQIISQYQVNEDSSNISLKAPLNGLFAYLMQFVQVVIKVSDIAILKRELVKSLFFEYFESFIDIELSNLNIQKEFYPEFDKDKLYPTPYAIIQDTKPPLCIYPVNSDDKCNEVIMTIQNYEMNEFKPETLIVFEDLTAIGRKPLSRITNLAGKQFSNFQGNEGKIKEYANRYVTA
jgi:hypothetical protein